jgi:hypothetical protein
MGAVTGSGSFDEEWNTEFPGGASYGSYISLPSLAVEVRGQEDGLGTRRERIDTSHKLPLQVRLENRVVQRDEPTMEALRTPYARFLADAADPFVISLARCLAVGLSADGKSSLCRGNLRILT